MKDWSEHPRITELQNEMERLNLILYPNMRLNEETPLSLSLDEWFETDPTLSEIEINQHLLKINFYDLFIQLHCHFMNSNSIQEINWRDLLFNMFEMKMNGFMDILPLIEYLKATNPHNWSKELK